MNPSTHDVTAGPSRAWSNHCQDGDRLVQRLVMSFGLLLLVWTLGQPNWLAEVRGEPRRSASQNSAASDSASRLSTARAPYQQLCQRCHGADGTGNQARALLPEIPNFADAGWQRRRSDAQLVASIIDGGGTSMPAFSAKLTEQQARDLAALIRMFAPVEKDRKPPPDDFEARFQQLQKEWADLRRQYDKLPGPSQAEPVDGSTDPPEPATPSKPAESQGPALRQPPASSSVRGSAGGELYRRHCQRCHGSDGTASKARALMAEICDFTDGSWQRRRSDQRLLASILDGKGASMPPFRHKLDAQQARDVAAFVRTFAPAVKDAEDTSPGAFPENADPSPKRVEAFAEDEPSPSGESNSFGDRLIAWLGRFHPAVVHFPIGLLVAAAAAGLLFRVTGRPGFDAAARFCAWFGAPAACLAVLLGWFLGGVHLTDGSWILTAHRWLGTSTAFLATLGLVAGECRRTASDGRRRLWLYLTLLLDAVVVLATGFLGGALVYGLDHHAWPS